MNTVIGNCMSCDVQLWSDGRAGSRGEIHHEEGTCSNCKDDETIADLREQVSSLEAHVDKLFADVQLVRKGKDGDPETPNMWAVFREAGMLWLANRALHVFGWAIVVEVDEEDASKVVAAYPERVKYRGFSRESEERGFRRVSAWMESAAAELRKECE